MTRTTAAIAIALLTLIRVKLANVYGGVQHKVAALEEMIRTRLNRVFARAPQDAHQHH